MLHEQRILGEYESVKVRGGAGDYLRYTIPCVNAVILSFQCTSRNFGTVPEASVCD
jgi:hypothetical protein